MGSPVDPLDQSLVVHGTKEEEPTMKRRKGGDPLATSDYVAMEPTSGCWIWLGARKPGGYGTLCFDGRRYQAHRAFYEERHGPIPLGLQLDHRCRVRACVNPAHLEVVTPRENTLRGEGPAALEARATACKNGHPFTPENTIQRPSRRRGCRTCHNAWNMAWRLRLKEMAV